MASQQSGRGRIKPRSSCLHSVIYWSFAPSIIEASKNKSFFSPWHSFPSKLVSSCSRDEKGLSFQMPGLLEANKLGSLGLADAGHLGEGWLGTRQFDLEKQCCCSAKDGEIKYILFPLFPPEMSLK